MSTLKHINLNFQLGDTILVGNNREPAEITKIEFFEKSGEVVLGTTRGSRKALTFALAPLLDVAHENPADRFR